MAYLGAKSGSGIYQAIIASMCWHEIFVEGCLGSGQILLKKPPAPLSIGIDVDQDQLQNFIDNSNYDSSSVFIYPYDAIDMLHVLRLHPEGVLAYFDPPYPSWTRTSHHRYKHEWTKEDHEKFLKIACLHPAKIMISTYPNDLYEKHLTPDRGWCFIDLVAMTRGGVRTERLYMNYPAGKPFYHTHAGVDYIDRQRIARKAASNARRFAKIENEGEKLAVLAAILATYDESET